MGRVYSTNFVHVLRATAGSGLLLYTVPDASVAIVRDATFYVDSDTGAFVGLYIQDGSGTPVYYHVAQVAGGHQVYHWTGREVLSAGETLWVYNVAAPVMIRIGGYLLED